MIRILYLSQYFPPEAGATQTRAYEMARYLVQAGQSVTVLTEIPNHPSGITPSTYRGKFYERANLEGIDVIRVWVKASPKKTFSNRMLFYTSFMFNAILVGAFLRRKSYDVILASSPPLFVGGAGLILSYLKRLPLILEVRDLWPASAVALGEIHNATVIRWATRLEEACYRRAVQIITVTASNKAYLTQRGIPNHKLAIIPNGANTDLFRFNEQARQQLRRELAVDDKFLAIYAGIFGIAQGLEQILSAAKKLAQESGYHFLLIGEGPQRTQLLQIVADQQLSNVTVLPEQPREKIPEYLSASDVAIIPLRNIPLLRTALPTKLFDAWACERAVVCAAEGEGHLLVQMVNGGLNIPAEDPPELVAALRHLRDHPAIRIQMGKRGRAFTEQNYSHHTLAQKLCKSIQDVVNGKYN